MVGGGQETNGGEEGGDMKRKIFKVDFYRHPFDTFLHHYYCTTRNSI